MLSHCYQQLIMLITSNYRYICIAAVLQMLKQIARFIRIKAIYSLFLYEVRILGAGWVRNWSQAARRKQIHIVRMAVVEWRPKNWRHTTHSSHCLAFVGKRLSSHTCVCVHKECVLCVCVRHSNACAVKFCDL